MIFPLSLIVKSTISSLSKLFHEFKNEEPCISEASLPIKSEWIKSTGYYAE